MLQDQFVFLVWSNLVFAKLFFARFLPFQLLSLIDLDSLELASSRLTSREGADSFGDIFYRFRFKSGKRGVLTLLIEHKSCYDRLVSFQILRYEAGIFQQMEENPAEFVDENGLFPVPYSILLCQKPCPQFDDVVLRCEGLDYGIHTHFQEICFDKIDVDALLDEPLLYVALGLARFAGYKDQEKESRQSELLTLFRSLTDLDPTKRENLKETWKFILEVSFNYLLKITRNTSFNMTRFKRELFNVKENEMLHSRIDDDVFEEIFGDRIQPYRDAAAAAEAKYQKSEAQNREMKSQNREMKSQNREMKSQNREMKSQNREMKSENQRLAAQNQELTAKLRDVSESYFSIMYKTIRNTLSKSGKTESFSNDVLNKLEGIRSYSFLGELLSVAASPQDDYGTFLTLLDKGASQEKNLV